MIDLIVRGEQRKKVVEVFVDNEAGVTADLCAEISRTITQVLNASGVLLGSYRLEVSSPGIDRPLTFPWQYRKHVGRPVDVIVKTDSGARRERGTLVSFDEMAIELDRGGGNGQMRILLTDIQELRVRTPW